MQMEDVFKLIAKMSEDQQANMMKFAAELKKPTEREQKELDAKEARVASQQQARMEMARSEIMRKESLRHGCSHSSFNQATGQSKHAWRAQVHTPGRGEKPFFVPMCQICHTTLPKILATPDMLTQGVNLDMYQGIDLERLEKWAEQAAQVA
jgi:hypothetical protein